MADIPQRPSQSVANFHALKEKITRAQTCKTCQQILSEALISYARIQRNASNPKRYAARKPTKNGSVDLVVSKKLRHQGAPKDSRKQSRPRLVRRNANACRASFSASLSLRSWSFLFPEVRKMLDLFICNTESKGREIAILAKAPVPHFMVHICRAVRYLESSACIQDECMLTVSVQATRAFNAITGVSENLSSDINMLKTRCQYREIRRPQPDETKGCRCC